MPTGYTVDVIEKDISFREFALKCMRAFGALVSFRDEDSNKIITEVPIDSHYKSAFDSAKRDLEKFEAKDTESQRQEAVLAIQRAAETSAESFAEANRANKRLLRMMDEVRNWEPPTADHSHYKEFMFEQLKISLNDMNYYKVEEPNTSPSEIEAWIANRRSYLANDVTYYAENLEKAVQRNKEANAWIKAVLDSLPQGISA